MSSHTIIPKKYYQFTFVALLILTVITVVVSRFDFGMLNVPIAILVASIKAGLVGAFFMGLRWEKSNLIFVFGGIAAIILFFLFTLLDIAYRGEIHENAKRAYDHQSPVRLVSPDKLNQGGTH